MISHLDSIVDGNNPLRATGNVVQTPARLRLWPLPLCGRVHFLVHSWSNNCYLAFQSAAVTAEVASSSLVVPGIFSITQNGSKEAVFYTAPNPKIINSNLTPATNSPFKHKRLRRSYS